jgi:hypothetical protein
MSEVIAGFGLTAHKNSTYIGGQEVTVTSLNVDTISMKSMLNIDVLDSCGASSGQVLTIGSDGQPCWANPVDFLDTKLREEYPALQDSWNDLMAALEEYQMVKKLVMDHDNQSND